MFRDVKPGVYPKAGFVSIFLVLAFILGVKLMPLAIAQKVIFIVVLCVLLFSGAITYALAYLYKASGSIRDEKKGLLGRYKYEIALAAIILITTLPLLTESYFYYDDWWNIGSKALLTKQSIITFARPIQILIFGVFDKIGIRNAYIFKWVFLPAIILYAMVLYRWLYAKTESEVFSFFLACVFSIFAPVMDLLGYTATSAVCYSILFSALSVICFERACIFFQQRKNLNLLINSVLAFVLLFVALLTYQVGTQIVFVFLSVGVYFNTQKKSLLRKNSAFLFLFGSANIFYLLFIKLLNRLYLVEITTNRSQIISSLLQVVEKIRFFKFVLTQSIMQVAAAFTGGSFILERYRGASISFSNQFAGKLLFFFICAIIFVAFVSYWFRTKNILGLLSLLAFIPLSYFVFLVLAESGYLTYYAFALISLLMFYFLTGLIASAQLVWVIIKKILLGFKTTILKDVKPVYIVLPILVVCGVVSNYYARDFYINYNSAVYNFVKYSIQTGIETGDIKRIHIYGIISPLNADVYSRFVAETALKDLGKDLPDYQITFSRNKYLLTRMEEADYLKVLAQISKDDKQTLDNLYAFDPTYRQYYIRAPLSQDDQKKLQQIFMLAGVIPQSTSPDTLVIDLTWTDSAYYNYSR